MNSFKAPDLNSPRYREKTDRILNKEFYKELRNKNYSCKDLSDKELRKIIMTFNNILFEEVIERRDGVLLPHQIGHLFIGTCKRASKVNKDMVKSAEYEKVIQHKNWETDGNLGKLFYTNYDKKFIFKNKDLWWFSGCREFTRKVSSEYSKNWKKYIEVDPRKKISYTMKKNMEKIKEEENLEETLDGYNEFEI